MNLVIIGRFPIFQNKNTKFPFHHQALRNIYFSCQCRHGALVFWRTIISCQSDFKPDSRRQVLEQLKQKLLDEGIRNRTINTCNGSAFNK